MKDKSVQHAAPPPAYAEREDVQLAVNRCPFCHDRIEVDAPGWTSCRSCQARHHDACWGERPGCSSCGGLHRLVPAEPRRRGALRCGVGIVGGLTALAVGTTPAPLELLEQSGALGALGILVALVLLVRVLRDLRAGADTARFERHAGWAYLIWGVGALNLLLGVVLVWSVMTSRGAPPEAVASAGQELLAGVKLAAFSALPVFLACALGLRQARARESPPPGEEGRNGSPS